MEWEQVDLSVLVAPSVVILVVEKRPSAALSAGLWVSAEPLQASAELSAELSVQASMVPASECVDVHVPTSPWTRTYRSFGLGSYLPVYERNDPCVPSEWTIVLSRQNATR